MADYVDLISVTVGVLGIAVSFLVWMVKVNHSNKVKREAKMDALAEENKTLKNELLQTQEELKNRVSEVSFANESIHKLESKNSTLEHEIEIFKAKLNPKHESDILELHKQYQEMYAEHQKLKGEHRSQQETLKKKIEQVQALEVKLASYARIANKNYRIATRREQTISELNEHFEKEKDDLGQQMDELQQLKDKAQDELDSKKNELHELTYKVVELRGVLEETEERAANILNQRGRIWEQKIHPHVTSFSPRNKRTSTILSIVNLKGGVGKTSLTANLAATLSEAGNKVLVIDLDYQRSLTRMLCSNKDISLLHLQKKCIQHFLLHELPNEEKFLNCLSPVPNLKNCDFIACSEALEGDDIDDTLDDAEMHLLSKWLISPSESDVRFHLRNALHSSQIRDRYNYILLDCPPRLSTGCVNALAASDYALIPVLLDKQSATYSAPNLLRKLRRLQKTELLAHLNILGIVANKVTVTNLKTMTMTKPQQEVWRELRTYCKVAWGTPVHFFDNFIKESANFGLASVKHEKGNESGAFAAQYSELKPSFEGLVSEILARMHHESQNLTTVPS